MHLEIPMATDTFLTARADGRGGSLYRPLRVADATFAFFLFVATLQAAVHRRAVGWVGAAVMCDGVMTIRATHL